MSPTLRERPTDGAGAFVVLEDGTRMPLRRWMNDVELREWEAIFSVGRKPHPYLSREAREERWVAALSAEA